MSDNTIFKSGNPDYQDNTAMIISYHRMPSMAFSGKTLHRPQAMMSIFSQ